MTDEAAFLTAILAEPGAMTPRWVYADWLDDHDDPARAAYLRATADAVTPPSAVGFDAGWLAFLNNLGRPFEPAGHERRGRLGLPPEEYPFAEAIGFRGRVVTFERAFRDRAWEPGLSSDVALLAELPEQRCCYGAADFPVYPFITPFAPAGPRTTAAEVLAALHPRAFRGGRVPRLDVEQLPYAGYHPGGTEGPSDEIHSDFAAQYVFNHGDDDGLTTEADGTHGVLKRAVVDGRLWYVLIHTTPQRYQDFLFSAEVVLFAVGRSLTGDRLIGVVTQQVCHNLCD
jgi:uncharacterized protein (TIGR02996 family)